MSEAIPIERVRSVDELQEIVSSTSRVHPTGAGTKPALAQPATGTLSVEMGGLSGIVEYEPAEYTITALAGTSVRELEDALRENGQYLPFDPVYVRSGSTVGGTVASGLSGSGRLRFGGIRDFILGTRFVDGQGRLIRGGGKVVKNAAGFDFPKLLVGSLGSLGILADATFKVFPRPPAHATVLTDYEELDAALVDMQRLSVSSVELIAMDLIRAEGERGYSLATRIGGSADLLDARVGKLQAMLPASTVKNGEEDADAWADVAEFAWADADAALVKIPVTPSSIPSIESELDQARQTRRYAVAGNLLWLPWTETIGSLHNLLTDLGLGGVVLRGEMTHPLIGAGGDSAFTRRVRAALDPDEKFQTLNPV